MSRPSTTRSCGPRRPRQGGDRREQVHGRGQRRAGAPGGTRPGQRTMHGHPHAALPGRALRPGQRGVAAAVERPRAVVAGEHDDGVVLEAQPAQLGEQHAGGPVDARHRGAVGAVAGLAGEALLHVERQVDVDVRQVQEPRPVAVRPQEADRLVHVAGGERRLVGLGLEHLVVEEQRERRVLLDERDAAPAQQLRDRHAPSGQRWRPMSLLYGRPKKLSNPWRVGRNGGWSPQCHFPTCLVA